MQNPNEIISWITENNYSKTKEYLYFISCISLPAIISFYAGRYHKGKNQTSNIVAISKQKSSLKYYLIPVLLYFLLLRLNISGQIDLYHEGEKLQLNGLPYKDFYLQHGLILNYLLPKFGTLFFSNSIEGVRRIFSLLEPSAYVILYFLGLSIFSGRVLTAIIPPLLCSGLAYWIGLREALAIAVVLSITTERSALITGLLSGLAFWFSIDYGIYSIATCICYFSICWLSLGNKKQELIDYLKGLAIITIPVLLLFFILGILPDFLSNIYTQLRFQSIVWGKPFWKFDSNIWSEAFRVYLSVAILIASICVLSFRAGQNKLNEHKKLLAITLLAVFFFRTALGRSDYGHWIDGSTLIYVLIFLFFDYLLFELKYRTATILFIPTLLYLNTIHKPIQDICSGLKNYFPKTNNMATLEKVGRIEIPESQLKTLIEVKNFVESKTKRNDYIYDFANQGAYYFLLERKAPSKYYNVIYAATKQMQYEIINELENKKPKIVIFSTGTIYDAIDGIPTSKRHKIVYDYIQKNYHFAANINNTILFERN